MGESMSMSEILISVVCFVYLFHFTSNWLLFGRCSLISFSPFDLYWTRSRARTTALSKIETTTQAPILSTTLLPTTSTTATTEPAVRDTLKHKVVFFFEKMFISLFLFLFQMSRIWKLFLMSFFVYRLFYCHRLIVNNELLCDRCFDRVWILSWDFRHQAMGSIEYSQWQRHQASRFFASKTIWFRVIFENLVAFSLAWFVYEANRHENSKFYLI